MIFKLIMVILAVVYALSGFELVFIYQRDMKYYRLKEQEEEEKRVKKKCRKRRR